VPGQRWRRLVAPGSLLVAVCVLHAISSIAVMGAHYGLGWDEAVYLSQINGHVPAGLFTAPRSRGMTLVGAPVTLLTSSLVALRVWLSLVTAVFMYLGFRLWLRLVDGYVVPLAALLFSLLWTTVYYGFQAMPNLYVALAAVPLTALLVAYLRDPSRRSRLVWVVVCMGALALIRPSDALYIAVALVIALLAFRTVSRRVRLMLAGAVVAGFVAGSLEWFIEAYVRFGDPMRRLQLAQKEQGGGGLHFSLPAQLHTLAGPPLCRGGCHPSTPGWAMVWWFALPLLGVTGVLLARRGQRSAYGLAIVVGMAVAAEYVLTMSYSAPRFLTPVYAMLLIPAAAGLIGLARRAGPRLRPAALAVVALAVLAQGVGQVAIVRRYVVPSDHAQLATYSSIARALRAFAAGRRCLVEGVGAAAVAYDAQCRSLPRTEAWTLDKTADSGHVLAIYLTDTGVLPRAMSGWTPVRLHTPGLARAWFAAVDLEAREPVTIQPSATASAAASRS
jgi:hypothetical protein